MQLNSGNIFKVCLCVAMGLMLVMQFRIAQNIDSNSHIQRVEELAVRLQQKEAENIALQREVDELKLSAGDAQQKSVFEDMKLAAGSAAMEGPGIVITIDDSQKSAQSRGDQNNYLVHDEDILRIINELRAAGAEAISINGQRLVATSEIRCAGPTLSVNNVRTAAPFEIRAIGDAKTLENALKMRGGPADTLKVWGIELEIEVTDIIHIPAYKNNSKFKYARISDQQ